MPCYERRTVSLTLDNFDLEVFRIGAERVGYEVARYGAGLSIKKNGANIGTVNSRGEFVLQRSNEELLNNMRQAYSVGIVASSIQGGLAIREQTEEEGIVRMRIDAGRTGL
jgi:hypothetical protein